MSGNEATGAIEMVFAMDLWIAASIVVTDGSDLHVTLDTIDDVKLTVG